MSEKIKNIFEKIKSNKKIQFGIIIALLLIIIILFILPINTNQSKDTKVLSNVDVYVNSLETRLENTLAKVSGVGKVSCVITVESGMETVLAMKTTTTINSSGTETVETPIVVNGKTIVLKELYPKINGVLIVAEGAKNITVMTRIQQATQSLLDIGPDKIEILSMK